jgi:hypothetical protein
VKVLSAPLLFIVHTGRIDDLLFLEFVTTFALKAHIQFTTGLEKEYSIFKGPRADRIEKT